MTERVEAMRSLRRDLNAALRLLAATVFLDDRMFTPRFVEARRRVLRRASRTFRANRLKKDARV